MPVRLQLIDLRKRYGQTQAVDGVSLNLPPGEITSLLGPSGCGKSTTLRLIAGFERADTGRILFDGDSVDDKAPEKRNVGMVFQNYSLFPHMTVEENIAFGLRMRKYTRSQVSDQTASIIDTVQLHGLNDRYPNQLSGGQQQRVALARALVINPAVLLLDEPLGALDRSLRESMQFELKRIQRRLGPTTVIVTHDQEEAMTLSNVIAVMKDGTIFQHGDPHSVYHRPKNRFVAEFLGGANLFTGTVADVTSEGLIRIQEDGSEGPSYISSCGPGNSVHVGMKITCAVRPEKIVMKRGDGNHANSIPGLVRDSVFRGQSRLFEVVIPGREEPIQVSTGSEFSIRSESSGGESVWLHWSHEDMVILAPDDIANQNDFSRGRVT